MQEDFVAADNKAKLLHDAEKHVLHGKVQQAIAEYLKIIKVDPNDVLILNTIGDLYLRQGNTSEANKYFSQVAESYVCNNFFLKAIAVYKKILNADPDSLSVNSTIAALYSKQGLSIDARNQYMRVAALLEREGRAKESMEAYEKIVELDPANSGIQRKLAELYQSQGGLDQAHAHWTGAARAQSKAGDFARAANSYSRAMQLDPLDVEAMRGYFECCMQLKDPVPALNQLQKSVESAPENLGLREMLGKAHLANNDPENAARAFQTVVSMDESRYENFFDVADAFIGRNEYDQAISCLDTVVPILISHRGTERAVRLYQQILQLSPDHVHTMIRLASIYSATGDQTRYLEQLERIAGHYLEKKSPIEAIEYLGKILQINPESEKYLNLHREAFTEAYPDTPYASPVEIHATASESAPDLDIVEPAAGGKEVPPEIVEVDLLINYGLRDKAMSLLQSLESRDPYEKEVRIRLVSLYKGEKKFTEAAEQCMLLAALYRRGRNEEAAQNCINEAKQLAPEVAEYENDLEAYALRNGIEIGSPSGSDPASAAQGTEPEVDLSSDLLDIFFSGGQESAVEEVEEQGEDQVEEINEVVITDAYPPQAIPVQPHSKPVQEQLQEVDFYIRLGFHDEALAKLNEIAKVSPDSPELASRYQKLGEIEKPAAQTSAGFAPMDEPLFGEPIQTKSPENIDIFRELELDGTLDHFAEITPEIEPERPAPKPIPTGFAFSSAPAPVEVAKPPVQAPAREPAGKDFLTNEMFADLMEEVGVLTEQEVAKESFEDHFSLGTAYREMELSEEAIKEFEFAMKVAERDRDTKRIIQCCGMLSTCYLKKGMPTSALRWCQAGLSVTDISSHEALALRYDMGVAHSMSGSSQRALECFDRIFDLDPGYRDVAKRIDEIKGGFERHAP
jgi:tetratricopeptide (TPR) repeat protein